MSTAANKATMRRAMEALNQENWANLMGEFFPSAADANEFRFWHAPFRAAFPDYHATIDEMIAEGDKVVVRQTVRATHAGEYPYWELKGIAPTGKQLEWNEVQILRVADGKILDGWLIVDGVSRLQQLGVLPPPE